MDWEAPLRDRGGVDMVGAGAQATAVRVAVGETQHNEPLPPPPCGFEVCRPPLVLCG